MVNVITLYPVGAMGSVGSFALGSTFARNKCATTRSHTLHKKKYQEALARKKMKGEYTHYPTKRRASAPQPNTEACLPFFR